MKKILITSMALVSTIGLAQADMFDFRSDFTKTQYVGVNAGYVFSLEQSGTVNNKSFPLAINISGGDKFKITPRYWWGYELGLGYLGQTSWDYNGQSSKTNTFALDALATFTGFFNPYFGLVGGVGPYWQINQGSNSASSGINAMFKGGAILYVTPQVTINLDIAYYNGFASAGSMQQLTTITTGFNYFF